ncbi:MAG: hypothetical protein WC046_00510 [Candidatus Bathyarchaeia archaeon]
MTFHYKIIPEPRVEKFCQVEPKPYQQLSLPTLALTLLRRSVKVVTYISLDTTVRRIPQPDKMIMSNELI